MENNEQLVKQNEKRIYTIERVEPKNNIVYCFTKRFLDIFLSIFVLVVLSLPMIIIAIIIRLDSPGPAFFRQDRLGKNGKTFIMYKYRTMYTDAEKDGPQWAKENDSRCTKVGLYLRKTRIDELPQFINVLKGEMSLVGPRPEREYFYDKFETYIKVFVIDLLFCLVLQVLLKLMVDIIYCQKKKLYMIWNILGICLLQWIYIVF